MRRHLLVAALLLPLAPSVGGGQSSTHPATSSDNPATSPAPEPAAATGVDIAVPQRVAGFGLLERHDYEDKSSGVQLRYASSDSVMADVFVYPGPDLAQQCALPCATQALEQEIADFRGIFPEMIKRGYVQAMTVVSEERLVPPAGAPWRIGHHMRLAVTRGDRPLRSEYYLYYLPGYRVKVRSTYEDTLPQRESVASFVAGIVPALVGTSSHAAVAPAQSSAGPAANERNAISITAKLPHPPAQVFLAAARALREAGFTLADSSSATGEINTSPSYAWPAGSEKEKWHGAESPGVVLHVVARAISADSTFFGVTAVAPIREIAGGATSATTLRMLSAMSLAGRVEELLKEPAVGKQPQ
jgi:hypothetical protein